MVRKGSSVRVRWRAWRHGGERARHAGPHDLVGVDGEQLGHRRSRPARRRRGSGRGASRRASASRARWPCSRGRRRRRCRLGAGAQHSDEVVDAARPSPGRDAATRSPTRARCSSRAGRLHQRQRAVEERRVALAEAGVGVRAALELGAGVASAVDRGLERPRQLVQVVGDGEDEQLLLGGELRGRSGRGRCRRPWRSPRSARPACRARRTARGWRATSSRSRTRRSRRSVRRGHPAESSPRSLR